MSDKNYKYVFDFIPQNCKGFLLIICKVAIFIYTFKFGLGAVVINF